MKALFVVLLLAVTQEAFGWKLAPGIKGLVVSGEDVEIPEEGTVTKNEMQKDPLNPPKITDLEITSDISNRYAKTTYKSTVLNPANITQETTFFVVTPEEAYITAFVMYIDGKNYTASVKEKKKAENIYNDAVNSGYSAAHVSVSTRNSNKFSVNVNVGANSSAVFFLSCEELLKRKTGKYSDVININPKQYVENLKVIVNIDESANLSMVDVLPLTTGEGFTESNDNLIPKVNIIRNSNNTATITFIPTIEEQKKYTNALKTSEIEGLSAQFIVTYDVERNNNGGEILVEDGYFVHFFAPTDLPVMPKYLIFVVDTSGSMSGRRIEQLRETLLIYLKNLNPDDRITIIEFNSDIKVYNLDAFDESTIIKLQNQWEYNQNAAIYREHQVDYTKLSFPPAYPPNADTIKKAVEAVSKMQALTSTNIYESLRAALHMVKITTERTKNLKGPQRQPIILFCTDGEPTDGLTNTKEIVNEVYNQNIYKVPIFSMSFGEGCDKEFLRSLSSMNYGLSRHIYEAADSTMQMESFYREISSPLLTNVTFKYIDNVTEHTRDTFPILFNGNEFVVSGKIDDGVVDIMPIIECRLPYPPNFVPIVREVKVGNIERQWAYLTTKQYLEKNENAKALDLALKYSFVTSLTSMVVVKPNSTAVPVDAVDAKSNNGDFDVYGGGYGGMNVVSRYAAAPMFYPQAPMTFMKMAGMALDDEPVEMEAEAMPEEMFAYEIMGTYDFSITDFPTTSMEPLCITEGPEPMATSDSPFMPTEPPYMYPTQASEVKTTQPLPSKEPMVLPEKVSKGISWLQVHVTKDDTLDFLQGSYKFGFGRTNTTVSTTSCTTILSEPGKCQFLDEADSVYNQIVDEISFKDYFCVINKEFVGLCCPA